MYERKTVKELMEQRKQKDRADAKDTMTTLEESIRLSSSVKQIYTGKEEFMLLLAASTLFQMISDDCHAEHKGEDNIEHTLLMNMIASIPYEFEDIKNALDDLMQG